MKLHIALLIAISQGIFCTSAQDKPDLTIPNQRFNYALGLDIVSTFKQMDVDIDLKAFAAGMQDALAGKTLLTTNEEQAAMDTLSKNMQAKAQQLQKIEAAQNLKEGQSFLAANKD